MVIWGLDGRKDLATGIDSIEKENLVENPVALKSRLTELQRNGTNPPLSNIEIEAFVVPENPSRGFVVCLVPEGPFKPYRSEITGASQYYIRAGDSFVVCSPSILRTLFYPRVNAVFRVEVALTYRRVQRVGGECFVLLAEARVRNIGNASARDLYVLIDSNAHGNVLRDFSPGPDWERSGERSDARVSFQSRRAMHPDAMFVLFVHEWLVPVSADTDTGESQPDCESVTFGIALYAENQSSHNIDFVFDQDEMNGEKGSFVKTVVSS